MDGVKFAQLFEEAIPEEVIRSFMKQLFSAVSHIHQKGYMHRDIKLDNILFSLAGDADQEIGDIKLCDFGQACKIGRSRITNSEEVFGSTGYLAPEAIQPNTKYNEKVDVYSLGVILY